MNRGSGVSQIMHRGEKRESSHPQRSQVIELGAGKCGLGSGGERGGGKSLNIRSPVRISKNSNGGKRGRWGFVQNWKTSQGNGEGGGGGGGGLRGKRV